MTLYCLVFFPEEGWENCKPPLHMLEASDGVGISDRFLAKGKGFQKMVPAHCCVNVRGVEMNSINGTGRGYSVPEPALPFIRLQVSYTCIEPPRLSNE